MSAYMQALMRNVKKEKGQPTDDVPTEEIWPEPGCVGLAVRMCTR